MPLRLEAKFIIMLPATILVAIFMWVMMIAQGTAKIIEHQAAVINSFATGECLFVLFAEMLLFTGLGESGCVLAVKVLG